MAARKANTTFGNPFGNDNPDEAQTEVTSAPAEDTPPWGDEKGDSKEEKPAGTVKVKVTPEIGEVDLSGNKITLTLKAGLNNAPWVVLHGADAADLLTTMSDPNFTKLLAWANKAGQTFSEGWNPPAPTQNTSQAASQPQGRPQAATQAPNNDTRYCKHGEMQYRTGSKNGKTWKGFFCPTEKGTPDQCSPEFIR
jgi:hypothetical protein